MLYRICLETGDSGRDAIRLYADPDLLGHLFVGPYLELEPDLAYVVEDAEGVAGYVLGALDTGEFDKRAEAHWWPRWRDRYPDPDPARRDAWTRDERMAHLMHHLPATADDVLAGYPSHLHIDLLPRTQGRGHGRRLMRTLLDALRARGSHGVHLGVGVRNHNAIGFYRHLGFTEHPIAPDGLQMRLSLARPPRHPAREA